MNGLKVKDSKIEGKGLFADQEFNEGDLIGIAHINGNPTGMIGRFHNHSDNPNAHSITIGNKKYLAALRPLMKGEEITVDYRRQPDLEQPEDFKKFQNGGAYYDDSRDAWVSANGTVGPNGPAYYQDGGEPKNRKLKLRKGDYDPQNEAGYIQETPDVNVVDPTIWGKYGRKYEQDKSKEEFINKRKKQFLALHPGLNKKEGVTMENFPQNVEQNFAKEYDYKKHTAMVKGVAKEEGWNPRNRTEYVDELTPQGYRIIGDSKYGSKLQPNTWSRALSGVQELGNTLVPGQPFKYNIPGLTKAEQKQMREDPTSAFEIFAPANTLGQNIANYAKNVGLSTGSDYKELPGFASGEFMPNVTDADVMALDPIQMALSIYSTAQLPGLVNKGVKGALKKLPGSPNNFSILPKKPTPIEGIDLSKGRASKTINPAKEIYIDPETGLKRRGDTIYLGAEWGPKYRGRYNNSKYADPALLDESMQPYLLPEDQLRLRYPWLYE